MPYAVPQQPAAAPATHSQTRSEPLPPTLRLRGEPRPQRRRIRWAADVVDNEGMGKKSSKVCCIYHKPRAVGESSDESSSSSDSDSDGEPDNGTARMGGKGKARREARHGDGEHGDGCGHDHDHDHGASDPDEGSSSGPRRRRPSPNAYERVPRPQRAKGRATEPGAEAQR